jgi:hypothetical protein
VFSRYSPGITTHLRLQGFGELGLEGGGGGAVHSSAKRMQLWSVRARAHDPHKIGPTGFFPLGHACAAAPHKSGHLGGFQMLAGSDASVSWDFPPSFLRVQYQLLYSCSRNPCVKWKIICVSVTYNCTAKKIWITSSQKLNSAALFLMSLCIHLWTIYIFPGSVYLFCCSQVGRPVVGIYKSLTDMWM